MSPVQDSVVQKAVIISTTVSSQVQWINLYVDGNYITSSPPYNFKWDSTTVANGSHTISIQAFNSSSGSRTKVGAIASPWRSRTVRALRHPTPTPKIHRDPDAYSDRANSDADTGNCDPNTYFR